MQHVLLLCGKRTFSPCMLPACWPFLAMAGTSLDTHPRWAARADTCALGVFRLLYVLPEVPGDIRDLAGRPHCARFGAHLCCVIQTSAAFVCSFGSSDAHASMRSQSVREYMCAYVASHNCYCLTHLSL